MQTNRWHCSVSPFSTSAAFVLCLHAVPIALALPCAGTAFSGLQALLCAGNHITAWVSVQALAELPALADVRLSGNPLFTTGDGSRFEVSNFAGFNVLRSTASVQALAGLAVLADVRRSSTLPCSPPATAATSR